MKRTYTYLLVAIGLFAFTAVSFFQHTKVVTAASVSPLHSFAAACDPGDGALPSAIFVPWYEYLESEDVGGRCVPQVGDDYAAAASRIGLAIIDTLTRLAAVLAFGYVLYGSIKYITSQGSQSGITDAKDTIMNAIVGLVIAMLAIGIVQFIGGLVRA
jgi:hypothetical protein